MDERQRKIEAGRTKWAEFKKKRSRSAKSKSPSNAVSSYVSEENSAVDHGGTSNVLKEPLVVTIPHQQPEKDVVSTVSSVELTSNIDTTNNNALPVMDVSSQPTNFDSPSDLPSDNRLLECENQSLQQSHSVESFTLESTADQSEASSSSDNSTITEFSSTSRSGSTIENETFKKIFSPPSLNIPDNIELPSLENKNDNRPDDEKALESIPSDDKEKDLLVEEILVSKESMVDSLLPVSGECSLEKEKQFKPCDMSINDQDKTSLIMEVAEKEISHLSDNINTSLSSLLSFTEAEDESAFLNADDTHFSSVVDHYQIKIKKYQEAIQKRDSVIHKLSRTLETTMNANQAANSDGNTQVEKLKEEINLLQLKMKETAELLKKQKLKNGNIEFENCACQTDGLQFIKCDTAIQVDTSFSSLLQSCDLNETSFFELFIKKFSTNSDSLHHLVQKLGELLTAHFSHLHIKELMTLLKDNASFQHDLEVTDSSLSTISDNQSSEKIDSSTVLKKINSLNMVAKLIESLVSISSGNANSTFSDFSPSKFQSFFLRRLHSMESGDILPDMSESESVISDFNYAEVEPLASKPMPIVDPISPIERLRQKNLSEDFTLVTDFLEDEMDKLRSFIPSIYPGPQGDGLESSENVEEKDCASEAGETAIESDQQKISLQISKLETRLKNLKLWDKELNNVQQFSHRLSLDSDTMTLSEDNIMMEELPLSCISLLSLTDSEYKGDNIPTDSETNFSRKISLDMSRSMQEREFCIRCERNADLLREKYENDIMNLKDQLEKSYSTQKKSLLESLKKLKADVFDLKTGKDNLKFEFSQQIESLYSENTSILKQLSEKYNEDLLQVKASQSKILLEKDELEIKFKEVYQKLSFSDQKICEILDEKSENEIILQNQIADLIQEHEQDLEMVKFDNESKLNRERKQLNDDYKSLIERMKKTHEEEINNLTHQIKKEFEEREQNLLNEHSKTISMIEAAHCDESAVYQKKIEQLLEEKCELLSKTTQEYETILNKNHRALEILCKRLMSKIKTERERVLNESSRSGVDLDVSLSAFEHLNNTLENGLLKFLNQNYFLSSNNEEFNPDETEYLPIEMNFPISDADMPPLSKMKQPTYASRKADEKSGSRSSLESHGDSRAAQSESSLDSDDIFTIHAELNRLQEEFQKDVAFYKDINDQLHAEINSLRQKNQEFEEQKESLQAQLQEKEKELAAKESMLADLDAAAVKGGSQLSASDIRSWQVQAAQTNSRLLHVLSDLVKTFLDIEHDINTHLLEYGLVPSRTGTLNHHDDDTGQSVGSREDFASLSLGECPNLELTEDGPDLTPRACDVFIPSGNYDTDLEGEDVVLGASRRLRVAVDHVLGLLGRAIENQQSQDLKLLLKRNEELSQELQEESQGRDAVNIELVTAESTVRKLEAEKLRLEDFNRDLKDEYDMLKRELSIERSKVSHLQQEKETALDEIHTLKEQCELLASRLGDPGKTENNKMLNPSGTLHENSELLEENSRLSTEKQSVQKSLSKERQSFLDRLHQMEIALEELNAEKDDLMEQKCKEIRDLKAEMEAMEKQLQSNRKFIEQQALEREQEREEFMNKINRMEEFVKEKERIQSSESQMAREIESLEELLRARIEDHKNAMAKKDEVEKELRQSVDKIRDLREVIEELEKQLDTKSKIEVELRQKLSNVYESFPNQDKNGSLSDSGDSSKHSQANRESMEHLHNLKEQLASRSQEIEMMSQSQTFLQELRGQIHFLEAKVEQRAKQLESSFLSAASSPVRSGATSPSGSQDSESLNIPYEDGWEMSPRSIHWLEIRRLEEKIGRLAHIDEELIRKNKELEQQLKKIKASYTECQHENSALQEKLSEQLVQISALKSHIDEQKHRCSTPQKSHPFAEKIEDLQEKLEKQIEKNKKLISDLQEAEATVRSLQEEVHKKEKWISILQKNDEDKGKQNISDEKESSFSAIDDLKKQLSDEVKLVETISKENEDLQSNIEYLKTENSSLKSLLEKAEKEIETERAQVESLCEEMANLAENSKEMMSDNKTNNSETISEEIQDDHKSKLIDLQNRVKAKNLEILMLKATVTKLESSLRVSEKQLEYEKVLVETLQQEMGSLTSYQKRLEQDFNTVQNMMQQKERELATLHEETETQMKLEAEMETLVKKLSEQKDFENELRKKIEELENQLTESKNLKMELAKKDLCIQTMTENQKKELESLRKQIAVLKNFNSMTENEMDVQDLVKKIIEASDAFRSDETNALQDVLVGMLRNCIDSIVKQMKQQHDEHIKSVNISWQEKISEEIENRQKLFKSEIDRYNSEKEKIRAETDTFWQEKIKDIETMLKSEEEKCRKISECAKSTRNELQAMYADEIATLRQNLDDALKEKRSLETTVGILNAEIQRLKQIENSQDDRFSTQYDSKLSAVSKTIQESFEKEKNRLQMELNAKLEQEKEMKLKHQKELAAIHQYFEARWANEMKKVQDSQAENLKKLKVNSEKMLEESLRKAKEEYAIQFSEERRQQLQKHKEELALLKAKHEKEKKFLLDEKENSVKEATDLLEKKFNENLEEIQKNFMSSNQSRMSEEQRKWEEEKLKLVTSHRKQLSTLKQELKDRYQRQLQAQSATHNDELKHLEETYNRKIEEMTDMIKEAKRCASKSGYSGSGSCRTTTPSSDITSSDEACSSCQEDMLSANKHILVDKIHQDGKRVLSLIESTSQPYASVKEAHLWLEERKWIVNRLKCVAPATSNGNLKTVIVDLVDEIQKFRSHFEAALEENSDLKQKCEDLEQQLSVQCSKLRDISIQLKKQKSSNSELESLLSVKTSEATDLKKQLSEASRLAQLVPEKETNSHNNGSRRTSSPSYESGCLRSADDQKSADKFSLFLPEIGDSPSLDQKTPNNKVSYIQDLPPIPKFDTPPALLLPQNDNPSDAMDNTKNEMHRVKEKLLSVLNKGVDPADAKLHGLYWVYRRSQSYNKALIYQKKYLLMLLRGFQGTERVALAWLNCMGSDNYASSPSSEITITDSSLHPKSRFRAVVFVIIALERMKFYVRRWRHLARIPSSQVINVEIQSVFQNYSFLSPATSPDDYQHSSQSLSSVTLTMAARDTKSSQISALSRAENKSKNSVNPDKSKLIEYVHRLEVLQKQLGLDNLR